MKPFAEEPAQQLDYAVDNALEAEQPPLLVSSGLSLQSFHIACLRQMATAFLMGECRL